MATHLKDIPSGELVAQTYIPAVSSGDADTVFPVFYAYVACKIKVVYFTPITAVTGADTHTRSLTVLNAGTAGTGTTALATAVSFTSGIDIAALDAKRLVATTDSATMTAGQVLGLKNALVGDGQAFPAGLCTVVFWPTAE